MEVSMGLLKIRTRSKSLKIAELRFDPKSNSRNHDLYYMKKWIQRFCKTYYWDRKLQENWEILFEERVSYKKYGQNTFLGDMVLVLPNLKLRTLYK